MHIDDGLYVCTRQGQNVAQALVPGMELAQAARVLVQALRQREQQPPCAVPALGQRRQPIQWTSDEIGILGKCLLVNYVHPCLKRSSIKQQSHPLSILDC